MSAGHQEGKDHSHLQGCPGPMSKQLGLAWAAPCPLPSPGPIPVKDKPPQIRPFWHLAWAGPVQGVLMRPGLQVVQTMFYCAAKPSAPPTLTQCWLEPCWRRPGQGGPLGFPAPPSQWPALSSFLATPRGIFWSSFTPPPPPCKLPTASPVFPHSKRTGLQERCWEAASQRIQVEKEVKP